MRVKSFATFLVKGLYIQRRGWRGGPVHVFHWSVMNLDTLKWQDQRSITLTRVSPRRACRLICRHLRRRGRSVEPALVHIALREFRLLLRAEL